ncbi:AAA family ATPase (plasmid) [Klebsiella pneumoniae subsp. pneumoniae]|uniref:AAA family ATPase n=2 Tax=Klebsiella pneumoniae TaxID=573 RepID=UPI000D588123|nr:ATP-binding protein [Klebsiella pneumoniae]PVW18083.1 hypothetical protein B4U33_30000 [Klebsiella pneumoniae]
MSVSIQELSIKKLFGNKDLIWKLKDVNVLVGKNGKGKTIILKIIHNTLINKEEKELTLCESANIRLSNGRVISRRNDDKTTEFLGSLAKHIIAQISKDKNSFNKFVKENKNKTEDELRTTLENILNTISPDKNKKNKSNGFFVEMGKEEDKKEEINVSYISTINMNANSNNEINKSSGERTTILAMETETEIAKILSPSESEAEEIEKIEDKSLLMEILNSLFKETDKEIFITSDFIVKKINSDITYEINDLSSGEKQLIYTLLRVANSKRKNQIILMDEPEISLHLSWQEKLLASIKKLRSESQIIVVTHSPGIVMDGWMGNYTEIDNILTMSE